jgi:hypothetical protein
MKLFIIKTIRSIILSIFIALIFSGGLIGTQLINPPETFADVTDCTYDGQCVDNRKCNLLISSPNNKEFELTDEECGSAIIGGVEAPTAISAINTEAGGNIGVIFFISRVLNFANIIAGILVMLNFVFAGFLYITGAGNASNMSKINQRLLWSIVGILVIVASYTLAAIFGLIFFNNATFIITPTLSGALEQP